MPHQTAAGNSQPVSPRFADLYAELGRQEFLQGRLLQTAVYLSVAYQEGDTGSALRCLLAQALRAVDAQLVSLQGHTGAVLCSAFSPDGRRLVTTSADGTARVWDAVNGQCLIALQGHTGTVVSAAFSPAGRRLVTRDAQQTVQVWDAHSGQLRLSLARLPLLAWSADGLRLVIRGDLTVNADGTYGFTADAARAQVWASAGGVGNRDLGGHPDIVLLASLADLPQHLTAVALNSDGTRLCTAHVHDTLQVWDVTTQQRLCAIAGHSQCADAMGNGGGRPPR